MKTRYISLIMIVLALGVVTPSLAQNGGNPQFLVPEVLNVVPHDTEAWTQGLLLYNGSIYESTGAPGDSISEVREIDPATGAVIRSVEVDKTYYGEGLARVDNTLIQLTWKNEVAFVYDIETFEQIGQFEYEGEGWGLCYDGDYIYMTNGSPFLQVRDPKTFELMFELAVTYAGWAVNAIPTQNSYVNISQLNELECVGDYVYSNVWQSEYILKIDKRNGKVAALIDARNLSEYRSAEDTYQQNYLNGIVYLPDSDTFLITGKFWPSMYEVRFAEASPQN